MTDQNKTREKKGTKFRFEKFAEALQLLEAAGNYVVARD